MISASFLNGWTFSRLPVEKLSITLTVSRRRINSSTICDPINPPPPVTTYTAIANLQPDRSNLNALLCHESVVYRQEIWRQADYKPNSVRPFGRGDHSSRLLVSRKLQQPTRKLRRVAVGAANRAPFSHFALLPVGVTKPSPYRLPRGLSPRPFPPSARFPR